MILTHFATLLFTAAAPPVDNLWPVTLAEAKMHCRVDGTAEDAYITGLIGLAADALERDTGIVCRARNITLARDSFTDNGQQRIPLTVAPLNSVGGVVYDAADGTAQTLGAGQYRLRESAGMPYIVPAHGVSWPATESIPGAVRVTVNAGYASNADIPATLRHAALLLIGHMYENREAVVNGQPPHEVPLAYASLIRSHRLRMVA